MRKRWLKSELARGSGNVFADFNHPDADTEQRKAILAASIIAALDAAEHPPGIASKDIANIRRVKLDAYSVADLTRLLSQANP